ncbi:porin [Fodinicurvata sediminis]|uniref:porin n=1 Tax=Fodinicurvata sediminis TaxID=1121832 RepID=UPI00138AFBB9|nr:porin [Fodinicurvata sediminis]
MKRCLMAATALAVSGGAFAAAPAAADDHAGEGFQLKIGGFYNALAIVRDQDDPVNGTTENSDFVVNGVTKGNIRNYDFNQRGRYIIQGSQTLDNGLELGFESQHEITNSFSTDRAYVYASGGFGRVHFGADRSAMYRLYEWTPTAGWGVDFTGHDDGVASLNGLKYPTSAPYIANNELMLTYITPRFSGIQAGVSFAPDTGPRAQAGSDQRFITDTTALGNTTFENIIEAGLNFSQSFDGFDLGWSGGFGTARLAQEHPTIDDRRRYLYSTALNVGFGGFDIGASYKFDTHGSSGDVIGNNIRTSGYSGGINDAGYGWGMKNIHNVNAGITYTAGPWTVGPSFGWTKESAGYEREVRYVDMGARYALAPGADLVGSIKYVDYDAGDLGKNIPNADESDFSGDGFAGMFGIQLNF